MKTISKITLLERVEKEAKTDVLNRMSWSAVVKEVILPQMACPYIKDGFMQLLADFPHDIMRMDVKIAENLFEKHLNLAHL